MSVKKDLNRIKVLTQKSSVDELNNGELAELNLLMERNPRLVRDLERRDTSFINFDITATMRWGEPYSKYR